MKRTFAIILAAVAAAALFGGLVHARAIGQVSAWFVDPVT
jgi:hypothetical protein